ncbi:hypothetical protein B0J11DRAFT_538738 [Dendryphion nanum]|uniref:Uncharacterized protein n=1 Tax=Dendryphion nanum TaxID=256645 RepID=A0A9P9DB43_9PLEO|nr:hypothetical protein B0J11DRAFT_538738 [Dendryphion nanum]
MSIAEAYHVQLGFWTNWSYGKIEGATLTLTRRQGGLLVAFLAIFVGAAGKSFWRVACFILHRMLSTPRPQDGIYHQLQAILRNSDTAQDAAWSLGQIIWAWRVPARFRRPFPRLIAIIILALFVSISFGVAGVFSSQITTDTANEVLLKGDNCGPLVSGDEDDLDSYQTLFLPMMGNRALSFSNYALNCYSKNVTSSSEDCYPYVRSKLNTTVIRNAGCPFSSELCKSQNENLIVDSTFNSHTDLGINAAPEDRFTLRLFHQCAPIVTKNYSRPFFRNDSGEDVMRYFYGPIRGLNYTYTQELPSIAALDKVDFRPRAIRARTRADYTLNTIKVYGGPPEIEKFSHFKPIQALRREDADVMLFFLSSPGINFADKVDDPWFSAHRTGPRSGSVVNNDQTRPTYMQDEPAGVLGCTMQTQYCNAHTGKCSPLSGYADQRFDLKSLFDKPAQKKMFRWSVDVFQLGFFSISGIVDNLGITSLVARLGLTANQQGPIPTNQWQIEVEQWVSASLASVQGSFIESGNGPRPLYERFRRAPNGTEQTAVCKSQKIMTTKYSSFSVLGVALILLVGGLIMVLDLGLEPLIDYIQIRRNKTRPNPSGTYARLEWNANTTLQLQRLAHEHMRVGTWKYSGWYSHPVTAPGDKLAMVDMRNEEHTLLVAPEDWEYYSAGTTRSDSGADEGWEEKTIRRADTFASETDFRKKELRRSETMESIDSVIVRQGVRRVDTTTTLVGDDEEAGLEHGEMKRVSMIQEEEVSVDDKKRVVSLRDRPQDR